MNIAVVIPAYNEAATIAAVVECARRQLDWIIVVDDGSSDASAAQAQAMGAVVLRQAQNQGKGASLWRGMQYALVRGAQAVITLDADGQHRPEDIPKLLDAYQRWPDRLIIAARLERREAAPPLRRFANSFADFWVSWAAGCPIADTQSGFRLYPITFLRQATGPGPRRGGFVFESALLLQAGHQRRYPVVVPIETLYLAQSRPSHYRPWRDTARIVRLVAGSLVARGLYPLGLLRSLQLLPLPRGRSTGSMDSQHPGENNEC